MSPNYLLPLLDDLHAWPVAGKPGRPRQKPDLVMADRGYGHDKYRRPAVGAAGIKPVIARRSAAHGSGLGCQRWVIERGFAHLQNFRRLRIRYERTPEIHMASARARLLNPMLATPARARRSHRRRLLKRQDVAVWIGEPRYARTSLWRNPDIVLVLSHALLIVFEHHASVTKRPNRRDDVHDTPPEHRVRRLVDPIDQRHPQLRPIRVVSVSQTRSIQVGETQAPRRKTDLPPRDHSSPRTPRGRHLPTPARSYSSF